MRVELGKPEKGQKTPPKKKEKNGNINPEFCCFFREQGATLPCSWRSSESKLFQQGGFQVIPDYDAFFFNHGEDFACGEKCNSDFFLGVTKHERLRFIYKPFFLFLLFF